MLLPEQKWGGPEEACVRGKGGPSSHRGHRGWKSGGVLAQDKAPGFTGREVRSSLESVRFRGNGKESCAGFQIPDLDLPNGIPGRASCHLSPSKLFSDSAGGPWFI